MKRFTYFSMRSVLLLGSVLFMIQSFGQGTSFIDARTALGNNYKVQGGQYQPGATRDGCPYILDDGSQENSLGLTSGGDIMWLNYFTATTGCELINTISLTWGLMSNGGTCRVILYEDPDDDGVPDDAVYLTEASTTVQNANTNIFTTVSITPTLVSGGFFVAALYQYQPSGEYPASVDQNPPSHMNSWVTGESAGGFDVYNLMNNSVGIYLIDDIGFPGNFLLRAEGTANNVPLSDWAIGLAVLLIIGFSVYRFRRVFI